MKQKLRRGREEIIIEKYKELTESWTKKTRMKKVVIY